MNYSSTAGMSDSGWTDSSRQRSRTTGSGHGYIKSKIWLIGALMVMALAFGVLAGNYVGTVSSGGSGHAVPMYVAAKEPAGQAAANLPFTYAPILKQPTSAVVNISSEKKVKTQNNMAPFMQDPFFRRFFGDQFGQAVPREQIEKSLGSGVIVSPDGYIITNNHVVDGADQIKVYLSDKREMKAKLIGADAWTDIAVLKIDAQNLPAITMANSAKVQVGDIVFAIGDPFGVGQTVTMGIVSATGRGNLGIEHYEDFIQTDAAINPGNSGGALINAHGDLIGINTAILSNGAEGNQGIGFAIPIDMARHVMDQILKNGRVIRGWLGVSIQPVNQTIAKAFGLGESTGALVGDVVPNSPASKSGLKKGDIILDVNGHKITSSRALQLMIAQMPPEAKITMNIFRNGKEQNLTAVLGEQPGSKKGESVNADHTKLLSGLSVDNLTPDIASQLGLPGNTTGVVIVNVASGTPAAEAGLQRGDVIQEVNRKPVNSVEQFKETLSGAGNSVLLLINRGGNTFFVVVQSE